MWTNCSAIYNRDIMFKGFCVYAYCSDDRKPRYHDWDSHLEFLFTQDSSAQSNSEVRQYSDDLNVGYGTEIYHWRISNWITIILKCARCARHIGKYLWTIECPKLLSRSYPPATPRKTVQWDRRKLSDAWIYLKVQPLALYYPRKAPHPKYLPH